MTVIKNKTFASTDLFLEFKHMAENLELERFFNSIYSNPKSLTTHLMNIKNNIADEIIINRKKGHANAYYFSFIRTDESKPLTVNEETNMMMNRPIKEQLKAFDNYVKNSDNNDKGGKDE